MCGAVGYSADIVSAGARRTTSTSDEDETVRENGSFDGGAGLGRPSVSPGVAAGVSRETPESRTFSGSGGLYDTYGESPRFGFALPGISGADAVRGPQAMAGAGQGSDPTAAMPVYEASGGPNTIVSAAGRRGRAGEMDAVRQT